MKRVVLAVFLLISVAFVSYGQGCSVCTKAAAGLDDKSAKGLNGGIVYLAILPLVIMSTVGLAWWKYNRNEGTNPNG